MSEENNNNNTAVVETQTSYQAPHQTGMQMSITTEPEPLVSPVEQAQKDQQEKEANDKYAGKTIEEVIEMHKNLESKLGAPKEEASEETPEGEAQDKEGGEEEEAPKSEKEAEIKSYQDKWAEQGGELTDEQWDAVQKATGMDMADLKSWESYVKAEQANQAKSTQDQARDVAYQAVGSEANFEKMADWADSNLSDAEVNSIFDMVHNPVLAQRGAEMLQTLYTNALGSEPKVTMPNTPSATVQGVKPFVSDSDIQKAMRHPEYGQGGEYDATVQARIKAML